MLDQWIRRGVALGLVGLAWLLNYVTILPAPVTLAVIDKVGRLSTVLWEQRVVPE